MSGHESAGGVVKIVELVGSSDSSFSDAVRNAVKTAARSLRNIQGVDVIGSSAAVGSDGELTLYKVNCKVAFLVEDAASGGAEARSPSAAGARPDGATTSPSDEPPAGITAETIESVDSGRED